MTEASITEPRASGHGSEGGAEIEAVRGTSGKVEVTPVTGLRDFLAFCKLPRLLYQGEAGFAVPLDAERWTMFARKLNPHFKLVTSQSWLARKDGQLAGRILAQVYNEPIVPVGASPAQFGCFDCIDDDEVAQALTKTAEDWLWARGATHVHGPFSPSIWGEAGLLVEGYDAAPMFLVPWNPVYLPACLERQGYSKARDLISYRYDVSGEDEIVRRTIDTKPQWRKRLRIRELDLKDLGKEAETIVDIFNDGWSENWGFVPLTLDEFSSSIGALKWVAPREGAFIKGGFMIEFDGVLQAFALVLPNLHEIFADLEGRLFPQGFLRIAARVRHHSYQSGRLLLLGLRRALHRTPAAGVIILAFIAEIRRRAIASPVRHVEFGWVLEDNGGMRHAIESSGARIDKVHRVYEKNLAPG